MAEIQNLGEDFFNGEDKTHPTTVRDSAGAPQDITGWAISWMVKRKKTDDDDDAILTKTVGSGLTLTTPASGLVTISVARADSLLINPETTYWHEMRRTDTGFNTVLMQGEVNLRRSVHE